MKKAFFVFILISFVSPVFSGDYKLTSVEKDTGAIFQHYSDKSRGWHWKEDPIELDPELQPDPIPSPPPPPKAEAPKQEPPKPEGPKPLSTAWIRENMPKYMDAAIDDPTPQNVSNYLYLQRYAMDSADRFSQIFKRVAISDPNLDSNNVRPLWSGAIIEMDKTATTNRDNVINNLSKKAGIWFFFRSDCSPCHQQAPVLALFAKKYGFAVFPISIDGVDMPNSPFPAFAADRGQAQKFNVTATPTIMLARPPDKLFPLGEGMMALSDLQDRIIELSMQTGLITEKEYKSTRPEKKDLLPSPSSTQMVELTPEIAKDPSKVSDYLRKLLSRKSQ